MDIGQKALIGGEDKILLWVDMLGYKNWLERQMNLEVSAAQLQEVLSVAFRNADCPDGVSSLTLSDTVLCYCDSDAPEATH